MAGRRADGRRRGSYTEREERRIQVSVFRYTEFDLLRYSRENLSQANRTRELECRRKAWTRDVEIRVGIICGEVRNKHSHVIGYNHPKEHIGQEEKEIKVKKTGRISTFRGTEKKRR